MEDCEQYSQINTLEINEMPQENNEDVLEIVKKVGLSLEFDIKNEMIDICHRLRKILVYHRRQE